MSDLLCVRTPGRCARYPGDNRHWYMIKDSHSNLYLGASNDKDGEVTLEPYDESDNSRYHRQQWNVEPMGFKFFIRNRAGKVLDIVEVGEHNQSLRIKINEEHGGKSQQWIISPDHDTDRTIVNAFHHVALLTRRSTHLSAYPNGYRVDVGKKDEEDTLCFKFIIVEMT